MPFVPKQEFVIHETEHWWVNHRGDTIYPGYLMIGAKDPNGVSLSELPDPALSEVGWLLARCSQLLRDCFGALRVYDCRYGHEPGHTVHYHIIPVYDWTVRLFEADTTCRKLQIFYPDMAHCEEFPAYTNPDGCDMTLFICRRFAERGVEPPKINAPSVGEVVEVLRKRFTTVGR